eukprot:scaffold5364_cov164-Amphora_coffeaeformis.AAC.10
MPTATSKFYSDRPEASWLNSLVASLSRHDRYARDSAGRGQVCIRENDYTLANPTIFSYRCSSATG